ncbi:MAG TPA: glycosyltransferase family 39 protein [Candidatus Nanoarchaeia archaeon]|nr:glycosyltransferase family 39 protein [Candidatus Nanoarchaeia archaeon]
MDKKDFFVLFIFVIIFLNMILPSLQTRSLYYHEGEFLFLGYSYLKYGNSFNSNIHPILSFALVSFPLLFMDIDYPQYNEFNSPKDFGRETFLHYGANDANSMVFSGRIVLLFFATLLGLFVYIWSKELFGFKGAIISLILYTLHPAILAYTDLMTFDILLATFFFIAAYFYWKYYLKPCRKYLVLSGIFFGLAVLIKPTSVVLLFSFFIFNLFIYYKNRLQYIPLKKVIYILFMISLIGFFVFIFVNLNEIHPIYNLDDPIYTNAGYARSPERLNLILGDIPFKDKIYFVLTEVPVPAPHFLQSFYTFNNYLDTGFNSYFNGSYSSGLKSLQYIFVFLVKNPISFLIIFFLSLFLIKYDKKNKMNVYFILIFALIYVLSFIFSRIYGGFIYFLPILPLLFVLAGGLVGFFLNKYLKWIILGLLFLFIVESLVVYPDYVCYFNQVIEPESSHKFFIGPDCDLNQDVNRMVDYLNENNIQNAKVNLSVYNFNLKNLNFSYQELQGGIHQSGIIVLDANTLEGFYKKDRDNFKWLRDNFEPDVNFGNSIFLYNITEDQLKNLEASNL